jgi:hypothetical protein
MAASFGMKNMPMMPPMPNPMVALNATTSQAHSIHNNNNNHHHNSSSTNANQNDSALNNSRAASTSRPHSTSGTPVSKRAKTELDETDGELEIDVQNDDAASSSARPSSTSHANGTSHKNHKSGRDSAQSLSSRDSSSTPKSNKQNMNPQAIAAAMASFMPPGGDLNALLGLSGLGGAAPFMDASRRLVCPVTGTQSNGKAPYAYKIVDGGTPHPVQFPADALNGPDIPK